MDFSYSYRQNEVGVDMKNIFDAFAPWQRKSYWLADAIVIDHEPLSFVTNKNNMAPSSITFLYKRM